MMQIIEQHWRIIAIITGAIAFLRLVPVWKTARGMLSWGLGFFISPWAKAQRAKEMGIPLCYAHSPPVPMAHDPSVKHQPRPPGISGHMGGMPIQDLFWTSYSHWRCAKCGSEQVMTHRTMN